MRSALLTTLSIIAFCTAAHAQFGGSPSPGAPSTSPGTTPATPPTAPGAPKLIPPPPQSNPDLTARVAGLERTGPEPDRSLATCWYPAAVTTQYSATRAGTDLTPHSRRIVST